MAYIRSNDDYDRAMGVDPDAARAAARRELRSASDDPGFCNPIKARRLAEAEEECRRLGIEP